MSWSKLSFNFGMKVWSSHCAEGQGRDRQSFVLLYLLHFSFLYNFCAQTNLKCMTYFVGYWSMNVKCILFRNFHVFPWSYSYRLPVYMDEIQQQQKIKVLTVNLCKKQRTKASGALKSLFGTSRKMLTFAANGCILFVKSVHRRCLFDICREPEPGRAKFPCSKL